MLALSVADSSRRSRPAAADSRTRGRRRRAGHGCPPRGWQAGAITNPRAGPERLIVRAGRARRGSRCSAASFNSAMRFNPQAVDWSGACSAATRWRVPDLRCGLPLRRARPRAGNGSSSSRRAAGGHAIAIVWYVAMLRLDRRHIVRRLGRAAWHSSLAARTPAGLRAASCDHRTRQCRPWSACNARRIDAGRRRWARMQRAVLPDRAESRRSSGCDRRARPPAATAAAIRSVRAERLAVLGPAGSSGEQPRPTAHDARRRAASRGLGRERSRRWLRARRAIMARLRAMAERLTVRTPTLEIAYEAHGDRRRRARSSCCTASRTTRARSTTWRRRWPRPATACSCPTCAATGRRASSTPQTPRMAQQAAIGQDLLDFMDALGAASAAALAGYDWGGRAACIAAILAPERVRALVTIGGYNVQNTAGAARGRPPRCERARVLVPVVLQHRARARWASSRTGARSAGCCGRNGRRAGASTTPTFERTAPSFDNPDFVPVVIHSYRHRHGNAPGDPRFDAIERRLADAPADHRADDRSCTAATTACPARPARRERAGALPGGDRAARRGRRRSLHAARAARAGGGRAAEPFSG